MGGLHGVREGAHHKRKETRNENPNPTPRKSDVLRGPRVALRALLGAGLTAEGKRNVPTRAKDKSGRNPTGANNRRLAVFIDRKAG